MLLQGLAWDPTCYSDWCFSLALLNPVHSGQGHIMISKLRFTVFIWLPIQSCFILFKMSRGWEPSRQGSSACDIDSFIHLNTQSVSSKPGPMRQLADCESIIGQHHSAHRHWCRDLNVSTEREMHTRVPDRDCQAMHRYSSPRKSENKVVKWTQRIMIESLEWLEYLGVAMRMAMRNLWRWPGSYPFFCCAQGLLLGCQGLNSC